MEYKIIFLTAIILASTVIAETGGDYKNYFKESWSSETKGVSTALGSLPDVAGSRILVTSGVSSYSFGKSAVIYAFDYEGGKKWEYHVSGLPSNIDVNHDYIAYGTEGQGGYIVVIGGDGKSIWKKGGGYSSSYEHTISIADMDSDGRPEFFSGKNYGSRGNILDAYDVEGKAFATLSFGSRDLPVVVRAADLNGDGIDDFIIGFATSAPSVTGGIFVGIDVSYRTPAYIRAYKNDGTPLWDIRTDAGVQDIAVADFDGDGSLDVAAAVGSKVMVIGGGGELKWTYPLGDSVRKLGVVDYLGNTAIAAGADKIYLLNSGETLWAYSTTTVRDMTTADLDGDGCTEIIAGASELYVIDCRGNLMFSSSGLKTVYKVHAANLNGIGVEEIAVGLQDSVAVFSAEDYARIRKAENSYNLAKELYDRGNYSEVQAHARNAFVLYTHVGRTVEAKRAESLEANAESMISAEFFYNKSLAYFESGLLNESIEAAEEGIKHARAAGNTGLSTKLSKIKSEAELSCDCLENLADAKRFYDNGFWLNASISAERAYEGFTTLGVQGLADESLRIKQVSDNIMTGETLFAQAVEETLDERYTSAEISLASSAEFYGLAGYADKDGELAALESVINWRVFRKTWMPRAFYLFIVLMLMSFLTLFLNLVFHVQIRGGLPWLFMKIDDTVYAVRYGSGSFLENIARSLAPKDGRDYEVGKRTPPRKDAGKKGGLTTLDSVLNQLDYED
ncbi:MAG TPA: hypothetical protein ENN13_00285 [Candidatus Altiarchaeales archaeon]|nr:hypothetical protein [Candidatus Altiarchaeales archaeon]